jgi:hypothetical protein
MLSLKSIFIFVACAIFCSACEKVVLHDEPLSESEIILFSRDIRPIFINCTGCHDGSRIPDLKNTPYAALINGNYVNVKIPQQSKIYLQLTTNIQHKTRASSAQVQKILLWVKQGARNN